MTESSIVLSIGTSGTITTIYSDELIELMRQGKTTTTRASHVEPAPSGKGWFVDLHPVGGAKFWGFETRAEALAFERDYINRHSL
ncbi:MAG: hypothetical protein V4671_04150 [Armatimonadota bacterium]